MSEEDITIMKLSWIQNGLICKGRLYYYQGNFFYPMNLPGDLPGKVMRAIRIFMKANPEYVAMDRAHPNYRTLPQLMMDGFK